jgi:hypothetical protein
MSLNPIWNFGCVDRRSRLEDFSPYCVGDMDLTEKLRKKGQCVDSLQRDKDGRVADDDHGRLRAFNVAASVSKSARA